MTFPTCKFRNIGIIAVYLLLRIHFIGGATEIGQPDVCAEKREHFFCWVDPLLDSLPEKGFGRSLRQTLLGEGREMGLCIVVLDSLGMHVYSPQSSDSASESALFIMLSGRFSKSDSGIDSAGAISGEIRVSFLDRQQLKRFARGEKGLPTNIFAPAQAGDHDILRKIVANKVIEALRAHYVCNFYIRSQPDSVQVSSSSNSIAGSTPAHWIVPVGTITIESRKDGYFSSQANVDLRQPGRHTYTVNLRKRRFIHSPFFYAAATFALAAGVSYGLNQYYYDKYLSLGRREYYNEPERFGDLFGQAKTFESIAISSASLSAACLLLSFFLH